VQIQEQKLTAEQVAANIRATKRAKARVSFRRAMEGIRNFNKTMSRRPGLTSPAKMKPVAKATGLHIAGKRDWKRTVHKWRKSA
jgi:hypothetical protein